MTEITDSIRPLYRPRAEVHAELADRDAWMASVPDSVQWLSETVTTGAAYVSESADDEPNDASAWVAIFGLAAAFVWFVLILAAALYGAYRFSR